jgi:hypothetical protein
MDAKQSIVPQERVERSIHIIRGKKVILDADLARLYGVTTKRLNEQVRRNIRRFPDDFRFRLTEDEFQLLRSQFATLDKGRGRHSKYLPYVFTEHGVAMLSSVLHSDRAIQVNIDIMRAFARLRELLATHKELARKLDDLEKKYDAQFRVVFGAIRQLMLPSEPSKKEIGFKVKEPRTQYKTKPSHR